MRASGHSRPTTAEQRCDMNWGQRVWSQEASVCSRSSASPSAADSRLPGPVTWTKLITLGLRVLSHEVKMRVTTPACRTAVSGNELICRVPLQAPQEQRVLCKCGGCWAVPGTGNTRSARSPSARNACQSEPPHVLSQPQESNPTCSTVPGLCSLLSSTSAATQHTLKTLPCTACFLLP